MNTSHKTSPWKRFDITISHRANRGLDCNRIDNHFVLILKNVLIIKNTHGMIKRQKTFPSVRLDAQNSESNFDWRRG